MDEVLRAFVPLDEVLRDVLFPVPLPERPEEDAVFFFTPPGSRAVEVGCVFPEEPLRAEEVFFFFCAIMYL